MKLSRNELEQLCIKYLNHKEQNVNCCECEFGAGEVLYTVNKNKFRTELSKYIKKLSKAGIIKESTNGYDIVVSEKIVDLFKYID